MLLQYGGLGRNKTSFLEVVMVRGCQKKIIYLKNTQSNIFEEAYFVIKDNLKDESACECDMVEEANRILDESFDFEYNETIIKKTIKFIKKHIITFLVGVMFGALIVIVL